MKLSKQDIAEIMALGKQRLILKRRIRDANIALKKLRKEYRQYMTINTAKKYGVASDTVDYWTNPKIRERQKKYIRGYFMPRYRSDSDFKRRCIASVKKYQSKPEVQKKIKKREQTAENREYHKNYGREYKLKQKKRGNKTR